MLTILRINRTFMEYMRANFSEIARNIAKQPFNQTIVNDDVNDDDAAAPATAPPRCGVSCRGLELFGGGSCLLRRRGPPPAPLPQWRSEPLFGRRSAAPPAGAHACIRDRAR